VCGEGEEEEEEEELGDRMQMLVAEYM